MTVDAHSMTHGYSMPVHVSVVVCFIIVMLYNMTGRWYTINNTNQPSARGGSVYGVYDNSLYLFGGCENAQNGPCFDDLWAFDIR
jgi:hypothetical protein